LEKFYHFLGLFSNYFGRKAIWLIAKPDRFLKPVRFHCFCQRHAVRCVDGKCFLQAWTLEAGRGQMLSSSVDAWSWCGVLVLRYSVAFIIMVFSFIKIVAALQLFFVVKSNG